MIQHRKTGKIRHGIKMWRLEVKGRRAKRKRERYVKQVKRGKSL